jgi:predicted TIM-barrel fold metal-dependent hydrolase
MEEMMTDEAPFAERDSYPELPLNLVSADSHVTEPPHTYIDRVDPKYRDTAPRIFREADGGDSFVIDGIAGRIPLGIIAAAGKDPRKIKRGEVPFEGLHRGGWDPKARLADQERDGVRAEIIYPSVGMALCNHPDADYKQACMWAYNGWLKEEFCDAGPGRLFGIGQTAVRSVKEAVEDFRRFKEMGFVGVMLPGNPATEEDYDDSVFDPLWQASVELGLPISFHILTSRSDGNAIANVGQKQANRTNVPMAFVRTVQDMTTMFISGRVFERNPELKLVCVEADAGWAPHYFRRMNYNYQRHRFWAKLGDMKKWPGDYFQENVYLTFQDDEVALQVTKLLNPQRLLWANDFPHSDSTWPWSRQLLSQQSVNLTEQEKNWIFRDNTTELYGLKVA